MTRVPDEKQSLVPILIMVGFTFLLIIALVFRVYNADRDLGMVRLQERQARLAAESGINHAVERMKKILLASEKSADPVMLTSADFSEMLEDEDWKALSPRSSAFFRIISFKKLPGIEGSENSLLDKNLQFQIMAEGRCGIHKYSSIAILQLYDLATSFSVFSSLDQYYYGVPIQPWVERSKSLQAFVQANQSFFAQGRITRMGICYDPALLHKIFQIGGKSPFVPPPDILAIGENYGGKFLRDGESPCVGPLYCSTPVVVDSHRFSGPVQTALFFYRRGNSQPRIESGNSAIAMNSSLRIQHAVDSLQGKNPENFLIDRDSNTYTSFIPPWRPDFDFLRELAKKSGIYVDAEGKGHMKNRPLDVDYHPGEAHMYSDSYLGPNSTDLEQDELDKKYIVLSTATRFDGQNNIGSANLNGARIIFSERSVYIRGDIGSDLAIVTPGHIFITGPTNIDSTLNLMLVAGEGTALSTVDLEEIIMSQNPGSEFINAAREWLIRAVIYKPGAGVYTTKARPQQGIPINFRRLFSGMSLKIRIHGACIGGNLQRWIDNTEPDSLRIEHDPSAVDRLPFRPVSVNMTRIRTRPVK